MDSISDPFNNNVLFKEVALAEQDFPNPALYVVALPIGNFADITLRALWVLSRCDLIGAEDTRETKKVLQKFSIKTDLIAVHQHNEQQSAEKIIDLLAQGLRIAIVTDAGTPAISDPGTKVVEAVRHAGYRVIPIPGCSAVVTALSAAGMAPEGFIFHGFLDGGAKERIKTLKELLSTGRTFVIYEAPHRMEKLAKELADTVDDRRIVIARELTKKFEEIREFMPEELPEWFKSNKPLGEFVIVVNAAEKQLCSDIDEQTRRWLDVLAEQMPTGELSNLAHEITGIPKKAIYSYLLSLKQ